jgi:LysM repeat protein
VHPASVKTHTVEAKETLYSISRKYSVSVDELKRANPDVPVDDMKVGQMLVLPKNAKMPAEDKQTSTPVENTPKSSGSPNPKTHVLQPKETLYALSRRYEVTVDDLKKANPAIDINSMEVGQVINIPPKSAVTHADVRKVTPAQKEEKKEPLPVATDVKKEEKKNNSKTLPKVEANLPEIKRDGYTKVNESGFVEMYETNSDFHYALHSTAPIGTIIFIENEESGQKVYVRVMGRLTDAAPGTFMKISRKAYEKLSKGEAKIKVSTSYIP